MGHKEGTPKFDILPPRSPDERFEEFVAAASALGTDETALDTLNRATLTDFVDAAQELAAARAKLAAADQLIEDFPEALLNAGADQVIEDHWRGKIAAYREIGRVEAESP